MKLISIKKITDKMILGKDICSGMGNILLPKGAQLKQNYAKRLQEWGVHSIYIQDNHPDRVEIDEELRQETQADVRQMAADFLKKMDGVQLPESVKEMIQAAIEQLLTDQNIMPLLVEMKELRKNIFKHQVDVCILAASMGALSGYDFKRLYELAAGAILVDVEQCDGTCFQKGLRGDQTGEYAKIIAIANNFLSGQTDGSQDQKQALKYIEEHSGTFFDPDFTRLFSQKIAPLIMNQQNRFDEEKSEGADSNRIFGNDAKPNSKHETTDDMGNEASPDANQQRQRMKNELLRICKGFLSEMDTEPIPEQVMQVIQSIIDELVSDNGAMNHILTVNESNIFNAFNDERIFRCMSVGILAVMTGASLGYTVEQLNELGTGAITVELEKTELSKEQPAPLPDPEYFSSVFEYIRPGFEKLEQRKNNPGRQQQISDFAKITSLADIYSTLTSQGIKGQSLMPHEVIEYIRDHGGAYFDTRLTRLFLQSIAPFLIGSYVLLNTGEKAKVLKIHKEILARPLIRVLVDSAGNKLAKPVEKDLEKDLTLFIVRAINIDDLE